MLSSFLLAFVQFVVFPLLYRLIPFKKSSAVGVFTRPDFLKKIDFARHCPNINAGGHKIQPSRKTHEDIRRWTFYLQRRLGLPIS